MKQVILIAGLTAMVASSASATLIAGWTMPTAIPAATTGNAFIYGAADLGVLAGGTSLSGLHAAAATTWSSPAGNGSAFSFSSNNWTVGDYYQISVSTTGYDTISLSWDQTRSGTGPSLFDCQMSTDGGANFITLLAGYSVIQAGLAGNGTTSWNTTTNQPQFTTTLSGIFGAANQGSVIFRFTSNVTTAAAGTNRIDNIMVNGEAVPAPGALALLGVAGLVGGRRRRA